MLHIFMIGCLVSSAYALDGADVVLSCSFVEEGGGMMGGGGLFSRTPATLVLRDLPVDDDSSLDSVTPFNPPENPSSDDLIFEVQGSSVEIPDADVILHADCNEQEVICEISHYIPRGADPHAAPTHFIGSLQVEGGGISLSMVLQVLPNTETASETAPLVQSKLQLPLSPAGTLQTEAVFVVFSRSRSITAPVGGDTQLDCGFRQQHDTPPEGGPGLEWRLQHRGNGRKILDMSTNEEETGAGPQVAVGREGASVDSTLAVEEGNMSLSLTNLRVSDEGTYICTVTSGVFQTQQIVQLNIIQPPKVSLSEERIIYQNEPAQKLSCHCKSYYPLDVKVEWLSIISLEAEPEEISDGVSLSSHRQHADGTFSVSAHLTFHLSKYPPGTTVTCRVTHQALGSAADVSSRVLAPEVADNFFSIIITVLVVTVGTAVFYQVMGAN